MTDEELDGLGAALEEFLRPYLFCCGYTQSFGHLHSILNRFALRQGATIERSAQAFSFQKFRNQEGRAVFLADVKNCENVGMVQRGNCAGFLLESTHAFRISGQLIRQHLERNVPAKPGIERAVNFTHAARAQRRFNFVRPESCVRKRVP